MTIPNELTTRTRRPPRRQLEVLETAARVFHEKGYEATTIQDIADALGILKGSVYYYIRSKEDLLYEILQGAHSEALANMGLIEDVEGGPLEKIRAFVTAHLTFNAENLTRVGVFFHDFRSLSEERRREVVEARDTYDALIRGLIRQGQAESVICPDIDAKLAAMAVMGMLNWVYQWYVPFGERTAAEIAEEFANLVVSGLACTPATHTHGHRSQLGALPSAVGN